MARSKEHHSGDPLNLHYEYSQLSLADLLRARDNYHFHLMNKPNVIGTAVGYYLIRDDPAAKKAAENGETRERTFNNSSVRNDSWPCVLVLVSEWHHEEKFGADGHYDATDLVPKTLFMPDGQAVPVCVVKAEEYLEHNSWEPGAPPDVPPAWGLGGGLPIRVDCQGVDHFATAGCLVTDGHYTYVLTAAHVCGDPNTPVRSRLRGGDVVIGYSAPQQINSVEFSTAYPDFPGRRTFSSVDAGLIRIHNINDWTSNIYGLPPLGPAEDVHEHNLSLRLIDRRVVGYGAASGLLTGRIKALFYRYRSVGGFDYVGDFLISPEGGKSSRHGDSGMIWNLEVIHPSSDGDGDTKHRKSRELRPLAMQWGGQVFADGEKRSAFAVATNLSTVCRLLEVRLVEDVARGVSGYWGRIGHFSLAAFAIDLVDDPKLKKLMAANLDLLSFDPQAVAGGKALEKQLAADEKAGGFVPLADVPDDIWKKPPPTWRNGRVGGRDIQPGPHGSTGPEHPNHYADIDDPYPPTNKTWRAQCLESEDNISPAAWRKHYADISAYCKQNGDDALARQYHDVNHQGLLPLRVWQLFDASTELLKQGDLVGFLTAAGINAHYIGDASQPLHASILANGDPRKLTDRVDKEGKPVMYAEGVHSVYETQMLTRKSKELVELIAAKVPSEHGLDLCTNGKDAAKATLVLMDDVATILPPRTILDSFEKHLDDGRAHVSTMDAMWSELGDQTAEIIVRAARTLAMSWDSAWKLGHGKKIADAELVRLDQDEVKKRYCDKSFVPSLTLEHIDSELTGSAHVHKK